MLLIIFSVEMEVEEPGYGTIAHETNFDKAITNSPSKFILTLIAYNLLKYLVKLIISMPP